MLELDPDNVDLLIENSRIARMEGNISQANNYLLLAMQKEPENSLVNIEYGLLLNQTGKIEEANNYFKKAKENLNSQNFIELLYLTEIFWDLKNYDYSYEIVKLLVKNSYKKEELKYLEKVYDSFVMNLDIRLIEDANQLLTLISLSKYLDKKGEYDLYSKLLKKRFTDLE
jgi:Tfp pilus assembly protein PilF